MVSINVIVSEEDGSSFYRLREPARVLRKAGFDVEVHRLSRVKGVTQQREADVFVFNRPIEPYQAMWVRDCVAAGKTVIVDMDDDLHHLVPEHSMFGTRDLSPLMEACEIATTVTVTTPRLLDVYGFGHGVVIPNHIPAHYLGIQGKHDGPFMVGWAGSVGSHPNDLQAADGGIAKGITRAHVKMAFVGPKYDKERFASAVGITWHELMLGGWYTQQDYPLAIAEFNIGVVPLQACDFNEAKSCLKGLEMAAVGVPFIASPTSDYLRLNNLGAGLIAENRNTWSRNIQELAKSADYRAELAGKGREVAATFTFEGNVERWADVWAK